MKKGKVLSIMMIVLAFVSVVFFYINTNEWKVESEDFYSQTNVDANDHGKPEVLHFYSAEGIQDAISDFNNPSSRGESNGTLLERIENLRKLLEVADTDFNKVYMLDLEMQDFMKSKEFSRSEKVYALWDIIDEYIKNYDVNAVRVDYLLDSLSVLQPIELTDNLIDIIHGQMYPLSVNKKLLEVLAESYGMIYADTSKSSPDSVDLIEQNGNKIKNLFNQTLGNPYDKEFFKHAILLYPRVASSDDYHLIDTALQQHKDLLPTQDAVALRIDFAMMDQNMMDTNLSPLLNSINSEKYFNEDKSFAVNRLSAFIVGASKAGEQFTYANKATLVEFFKENEPPIDSQYFQEDSFGAMSDYGSWFDAYSTLNSTNAESKQEFINDFINTATILQKVAIINKISIDKMESPIPYKGLKENEGLKSSLNYELYNPVLSEAEKTAIRDALQALSQ